MRSTTHRPAWAYVAALRKARRASVVAWQTLAETQARGRESRGRRGRRWILGVLVGKGYAGGESPGSWLRRLRASAVTTVAQAQSCGAVPQDPRGWAAALR